MEVLAVPDFSNARLQLPEEDDEQRELYLRVMTTPQLGIITKDLEVEGETIFLVDWGSNFAPISQLGWRANELAMVVR